MPVPLERRRVLVVEDEPIVLDFISTVLRQSGYQMVSAADGKQAHRLFRQHAPELALILVEILVPGMDGAEFITSLPTLSPRIPIVLITCLGDAEVKEKLDGQFPVLFKPFTPADLKVAVQSMALA